MSRTRKAFACFAALLLSIFILFFVTRRPAKPSLSFGPVTYQNLDSRGYLLAELLVTNTGPVAIHYNKWNFGGDATLWIETSQGWKKNYVGPIAFMMPPSTLLTPGTITLMSILLPPKTSRWQMEYHVAPSSPREHFAERLSAYWKKRVNPENPILKIFSDKAIPAQRMRSGILKIPPNCIVDPP